MPGNARLARRGIACQLLPVVLHIAPPLRAAAALVALASYAYPLALTPLAELRHAAYHVLEAVDDATAAARALGLVHTYHEAIDPKTAREGSGPGGGSASYVHEHGGRVHAHDGDTGALLLASARTAGEDADSAPPFIELSSHVPITDAGLAYDATHVLAATDALAQITGRALTPPRPPPPRA